MSRGSRVRCIICGREEALPGGKTLRSIGWFSPDENSLDRCVCKEHTAGFISGDLKPLEKETVEKHFEVIHRTSKNWPIN